MRPSDTVEAEHKEAVGSKRQCIFFLSGLVVLENKYNGKTNVT